MPVRYTVKQVSQLTGVSSDLLRAWERPGARSARPHRDRERGLPDRAYRIRAPGSRCRTAAAPHERRSSCDPHFRGRARKDNVLHTMQRCGRRMSCSTLSHLGEKHFSCTDRLVLLAEAQRFSTLQPSPRSRYRKPWHEREPRSRSRAEAADRAPGRGWRPQTALPVGGGDRRPRARSGVETADRAPGRGGVTAS